MKKKYKYTAILTFVISLMMVVSVMFPMVTSAEDSMTSSTTDSTKTTDTTDAKTETSTKSSTDSSSKDSSDEVEDSADELVEKESSPAFSSEKTVDGVKVKVTADANVFPEGTTMEVKKVSLTSSEKKLISLKQDSKQSTIKQYSFDITMKNKDGEEIEPDTSKGKVKVSFENDYVKRLEPEIKFFCFEKTESEYVDLNDEQRAEENINIRNGFNFAKKVLSTNGCDLLILDEILGVLDVGVITVEDLKGLLEAKSDETTIIMTGIQLKDEVVSLVDEISKIESMPIA